uniref:Sodium channel epithelial 1 subunit delta n=1 Tax=Latimeria chalumnae TaxID=7897 RepID=H3BHF6_LATCH
CLQSLKMAQEEDKEEAVIEFYDSFKDLFQFFCAHTTVHGGIRLICSERNMMKTAFWIILFFASFGLMYWQFGLLFSQYWGYPVSVAIRVHSGPKIFPAVTVCTLNPYRYTQVHKYLKELDQMALEVLSTWYGFNASEDITPNDSIGDGAGHGIKNISDNMNITLDQSIPLVLIRDKDSLDSSSAHSFPLDKKGFRVGFRLCNVTGKDCFYQSYSSVMDAIQEWYKFHFINIMSQVSPMTNVSDSSPIGNVIYSCQYNGKSCSGSEYEHFHHPVYGICYIFKSNGSDTFWETSKPGIAYGLSLIIGTKQEDFIPLLSTVAGTRVMIHKQDQPAFMEDEGLNIKPGTETSIGMKQDEVNRLAGNYGQCTFDGTDVKIKLYNTPYSVQACVRSCFQYLLIQECGCGYYYYPLPPGAQYCNYNKYPSWETGHCYYKLYKKFVAGDSGCFQKCPKPCQEFKYKLTTGISKWPSQNAENWIFHLLSHHNGKNLTNNRRDVSKLNIFFQKLSYESFDETPSISAVTILSQMGNLWSFWFGSSVLSVIELIELILDVIAMSFILTFKWHKLKK